MSVNEKDILANEITLDQTSLSLVKGQSKKIETGALPLTRRMAETFSETLGCRAEDLLGTDAVRTIVVSADGRKERPFRELFEAFIRGYEKPFNETSLGKRKSPVFADRNDLVFYDAMMMLLRLPDSDLGRVFRLIDDLANGRKG